VADCEQHKPHFSSNHARYRGQGVSPPNRQRNTRRYKFTKELAVTHNNSALNSIRGVRVEGTAKCHKLLKATEVKVPCSKARTTMFVLVFDNCLHVSLTSWIDLIRTKKAHHGFLPV
jgi:hypothetical protein